MMTDIQDIVMVIVTDSENPFGDNQLDSGETA